jgi:predicted dithiol-disulfide oxidoreductase (DUF899 family)
MSTHADDQREQVDEVRLQMELLQRREPAKREVVVLEAANEDALRRTHARYFKSAQALVPSAPEGAVVFAAMSGTNAATYARERPGMSAFVLEDGIVYHTYSTYARGLDALWGMYQWLDRAPKGRNETGVWWHRHDEYANQATGAR